MNDMHDAAGSDGPAAAGIAASAVIAGLACGIGGGLWLGLAGVVGGALGAWAFYRIRHSRYRPRLIGETR